MPKRRDTKIGEHLYDFLRDWEDYISPYMLEKFEELFDDVEDFETEYTDEISELNSKVDNLEDKISDMESNHQEEVHALESQVYKLENEVHELANREGY